MHLDHWKRVKEDRLGRLGILILAIILALALLAPAIAPQGPGERGEIFDPPSKGHLLGTNDVGHDVLSDILYGARTSLAVAFGVVGLSTLISVLVGGSSALIGGLYDRFWMRTIDAMIALPALVIVILVATYLQPSIPLTVLLISLLSWPGGARVVRAQTLSLKERTHVFAARTFGADSRYVLLRHVVPDMGPILVAIMIQDARRAVFMEAGLSFLGVSDPSVISWGKMMHQALGFTYLDVWKWWLLPAGLALSLTVMGFSFVGSALETAMNPRLRRTTQKGDDGKRGNRLVDGGREGRGVCAGGFHAGD